MKKLPILLTGAVLVTSTLTSGVPNMYALADKTEEINAVVANINDPFMNISKIDPVNRMIEVTAGYGDWWVRRVILVYRDYEYAVTEEKADAALATLGEGDDSWAIKLLDRNDSTYEMQHPNISLTLLKGEITGNLTNELYYAVQYGHKVKRDDGEIDWEDVAWSRGKVNYRSCAHSSIFDKETMACERVVNADNTISYKIVMANNSPMVTTPPENEEIMDWYQEWGLVLNEDCTTVMRAVAALKKTLQDGEKILDQNDELLEKVRRNVGVVNPALNLGRRVNSAQESINELRKFYEITDTSTLEQRIIKLESEITEKDSKISILENKNQEIKSKADGLEVENNRLKTENDALKAENEALEAELSALKVRNQDLLKEIDEQKVENLALLTEKQVMETEKSNIMAINDDLSKQNENLKRENEQLKSSSTTITETETRVIYVPQEITEVEIGKAEENKEDSSQVNGESVEQAGGQELASDRQTEVELPKLGTVEEQKVTGAWWLVIPVVGFLGMLIWWMKRAFSGRR